MNENKLRDLYGPATEKASAKIMKSLDVHSVQFIESSNFLVMGTFDGEDIDLSPKGDPGGFVKVLSQDLIEIADRPGNNRIDGLLNISNNSIVSLIFFIPKVTETLRVQGKATISNDPNILKNHQLKSNLPKTVTIIKPTKVFLHCGKALLRSSLWKPESWPDKRPIPTLYEMIEDQTGLDCEIKKEDDILEMYERELYENK
jgi:PPOX class probable FMN-dependent enzyme